jgi:uncharacterized damage-inducible protein DinB
MAEEKLICDLLIQQYGLVTNARAALLTYCGQISEEDFLTNASSFGRGSIRNLLVHIANVYEFWLLRNVLKINTDIRDFNSVKNIADCTTYFESVNETVTNFVREFKGRYHEEFSVKLGDRLLTITPIQVFTHVITHEFHHKGQILSLSRHLGYTPIDTDVIR